MKPNCLFILFYKYIPLSIYKQKKQMATVTENLKLLTTTTMDEDKKNIYLK